MNLLTTIEVAEKLKISVRQVQTLIKQKKLLATKKGRDYFILETDVENLPERKKTGRPKKTNE
jgi:excisionase family DNA binding protein